MKIPIALPLAELAPSPSLFTHESVVHGQSHVARVMVHAFRLIEATGCLEEAPSLWAAVYLHDLARTHDGICQRHGADAMKKFEQLSAVKRLFTRGGVREEDYAAIHTAVVHHCVPKELDRSHPHWRLTALLKDADALDRVRLFDLDPRYLRHPEARRMVAFAEALFERTAGAIATGDRHFVELWAEAGRIGTIGDPARR
jgi:hypothetical protein